MATLESRYEYDPLKPLGQGGMCMVYKAFDTKLKIDVVLKECILNGSREENAELRQSIRGEAEILAQFGEKHGLPDIYDIIELPDRMFIVEEFVEGKNLDQILEEGGPLQEKKAVHYALKVCDILIECHEHRDRNKNPAPVYHKDIKPANIIIKKIPGKPDIVKLVDFGIAAKQGSPSTQILKLSNTKGSDQGGIGTPGFAPPEHYSARTIPAPTMDVYALGATLYHLALGEMPPESPALLTGTKKLKPLKNKKLETIIHKACALEIKDRYASISAMKRDLENFLGIAKVSPAKGLFEELMDRRQYLQAIGKASPAKGLFEELMDRRQYLQANLVVIGMGLSKNEQQEIALKLCEKKLSESKYEMAFEIFRNYKLRFSDIENVLVSECNKALGAGKCECAEYVIKFGLNPDKIDLSARKNALIVLLLSEQYDAAKKLIKEFCFEDEDVIQLAEPFYYQKMKTGLYGSAHKIARKVLCDEPKAIIAEHKSDEWKALMDSAQKLFHSGAKQLDHYIDKSNYYEITLDIKEEPKVYRRYLRRDEVNIFAGSIDRFIAALAQKMTDKGKSAYVRAREFDRCYGGFRQIVEYKIGQ